MESNSKSSRIFLVRAAFAALLLLAFFGVGYATFTQAYAKFDVVSRIVTPITVSHLGHDDMSFTAVAERGEAHAIVLVERGHLRDEDFVRDPEIDSPYETNIVIYNRHGFPLIISHDGDIPVIDPATGDVIATKSPQDFELSENTNQTEQLEDLQFVVDLAKSLRRDQNIGEKFRWEIRTIQEMGQWGLDNANNALDGLIEVEPTPDIEEIKSEMLDIVPGQEIFPANRMLRSTTYIYQTYVRWKNCCWGWGDHSAVLVNVFNESTLAYVLTIGTRNHGTEAIDSSMANASGCPKSWGGRSLVIPQFQPFIGTDTYGTGDAGGCGTPYGLTSGTHVCNDDSLAQYWNLKYNTQASWLTCSDATLRTAHPTCS